MPVEPAPGWMVVGLTDTDASAGGALEESRTDALSVWLFPSRVAVTVTEDEVPRVETPKTALSEPAGTVTKGGTASASGSLLSSATAASSGVGTSSPTRLAPKETRPTEG